jgi:hypothetical protein
MAAQAGIAFIRAGSKQLSAKGSLNVKLQDYERSVEVDALGGVHVTKKVAVCYVDGTFYLRDSDETKDIEAQAENVAVTVQMASGRTGTLRDGTLVGEIVVNTEEGTFNARWEGVGAWDRLQNG